MQNIAIYLTFLTSEFIDIVLVIFVDIVFATLVYLLYVSFMVLLHKITELSSLHFK